MKLPATLIRTAAVARKEGRHILRDWRSLLMALAIPALMLLLFGYALTLDVDRVPFVVWDQDGSPESRELIARFDGSRYFSLLAFVDGYAPIERLIDEDRCVLALVIPRDFGRTLRSGRPAEPQLIVDGSNSNTAMIALGYAETLARAYSFELQARELEAKGGGKLKAPVDPQPRVWYNSELQSRNYIVPGLIAVILMIIAAMLTSLTIAREWENGSMEQLLSTPVRAHEIVLGKMAAYFALGAADTAAAMLLGVGVFGVPLRGSLLLVAASSAVFMMGGLFWGIFLSAATRNQLEAYQMGMVTSFLPAFLLSGFIFAIENMPAVIQAVSYIFPSRYFITILKGVFLKGVGLRVLWTELAFLLLYALVVFAAATRKLRQRIA